MSMPIYVPPEQLVKDRAEFARKGIARGKSIVALEYENGMLLLGENPSGSLRKMGEIYDRIAFAGVGRFNEFETLRVAGVRYADLKGYSYGRIDVTAKGLANAYSQTLGQIFTHEIKPYEIEVLIAEVGDEVGDTRMFVVRFDGTLDDLDEVGAIGGKSDDLVEKLKERYESGWDLAAAIRAATTVLEQVEGKAVAADQWEAAVLDRTLGRRKFRRVTADEIASARQ